MTPSLTDAMVESMDETADFMHGTPPPFPTMSDASGLTFGRQPKPVKLFKGLVTVRSHGISITGAAQGQADADRRDAIKRAIS